MKKEGATRDELISAMHATTAKVHVQSVTKIHCGEGGGRARCYNAAAGARLTCYSVCDVLRQVQVVEERAREELARQIQVLSCALAHTGTSTPQFSLECDNYMQCGGVFALGLWHS